MENIDLRSLSFIELLALDAQNRHKDGYLYKMTYDEVKNNRYYDFELIITFINKDLYDFENSVIAGGCFKSLNYYEDHLENDIDIFIYQNHDFCIRNYGHSLPTSEHNLYFYKYYAECSVRDSIKHQIILRKYSTIAEILYGFDIGPSQVAYDGEHFYFTIMSKYTFDTGYMILDTSRRSTTFEKRIKKYCWKGFKPIFPFLSEDESLYVSYDERPSRNYFVI